MQELSLNGLHEGNGAGSNLAVMGSTSIRPLGAPHHAYDAFQLWFSQGHASPTEEVTPFGYLPASFRRKTFCDFQTQAAITD